MLIVLNSNNFHPFMQISVAEARMKAPSRLHYWKALERTGYRMPSIKSRICTNDFMTDVRFGHVYCLQYSTLRLKSCVSLPPQK